MDQLYLIKNTATINYSYIVADNRAPVVKHVEDSVSNIFIPKKICEKTYKIADKVIICDPKHNVRCIKYATAKLLKVDLCINNKNQRKVIIISGIYKLRISYISRKGKMMLFCPLVYFCKVLPLNECFEKISDLKRMTIHVKDICREKSKWIVNVCINIKVEG